MKLNASLAILGLYLSSSIASAASWPTAPDHVKTPGVARTGISLHTICTTKWGTDQRFVTAAMKQQVMDDYSFDPKNCPLTKLSGKNVHRVEIDHLIPRALGGADDVKNLWPECYEKVATPKSKQLDGAHKKDMLETALNKRLCKSGKTPTTAELEEYQKAFQKDWKALFKKTYGAN
jgi:hypothetical protein